MFRIPSSYWGRNVSFQLERFLGNKPKKNQKKKADTEYQLCTDATDITFGRLWRDKLDSSLNRMF